MTMRYAHHCSESLRDGVDVLEKVDYNLTTVGDLEGNDALNADFS